MEIEGKFGKAKVFTENIEEEAINQIKGMMDQEFISGENVVIMPDVHAGKGCTIGTTMTIDNGKVCPNLVGVDIGCLDKDTEILTKNGWLSIDSYNDEEIMVYEPETNRGKFEKPHNYIVQECKEFYHFKNAKGLDQMVCDNHRMLVFRGHKARGYTYEFIQPDTLLSRNLKKGYYGFKTSFLLDDAQSGLSFTDAEIRVIAMVSADGTIRRHCKNNYYYEFHLKKERKIARAAELLKSCGIPFRKKKSKYDDTYYIYFKCEQFFDKDLRQFYKASRSQLKVLCEECLLWDGHINSKDEFYCTTIETNADVIQYAFAANDIRAGKYKLNFKNDHWRPAYQVRATKNNVVGYYGENVSEKVKSEDGKKYCFKTSTGAFLARRNGKMFLTGNCGILVAKIGNVNPYEWGKLDTFINENIPSGQSVHSKEMIGWKEGDLSFQLSKLDRIKKSVGSLGGGNHFIEVAKNEKDEFFLLIHSGSRGLGVQVATHHQNQAITHNQPGYFLRNELIESLKSQGRQREIQNELAKFRPPVFDKELAYLEGELLEAYLNDMKIAQEYALANRLLMAELILDYMDWKVEDHFDSIHNYIDLDKKILRKGATDASEGTRLVIPLNMRDGSIIATGKGNPDWNFSAPHGAGRVMSRTKAKERLSMDDFKSSMNGIFTTSVMEETLDEAPFAYKNPTSIIENIGDTVEINEIIKPVYNFKAKD